MALFFEAVPILALGARGAAAGWEFLPEVYYPFLIFTLRTADLTLSTLRIMAVVKGRRSLAWGLGFGQALLFVSAVAGVLSNIHDPWNWLAYALGFATGNAVGITLENRCGFGHSLLQIISLRRASALAEALRAQGFGVTELTAQEAEGTVGVLLCYVPSREIGRGRRTVIRTDPEAFVTVEVGRTLQGGWRT